MKLTVRKITNIVFYKALRLIPYFHFIHGTRDAQCVIRFREWLIQKVFGFNRHCYWPVHFTSIVTYPNRIYVGIDTNPGFSNGCNIHGINGIYIGDYTQMASGIGIQSGNHSVYDNRIQMDGKPVRIGKYCWVGQNAIILPEVELGDFTIVGAGAVVTKSFPKGYCVIGGVPAKKIRDLNPNECIRFQNEQKYNGFMKHESFLKNPPVTMELFDVRD